MKRLMIYLATLQNCYEDWFKRYKFDFNLYMRDISLI